MDEENVSEEGSVRDAEERADAYRLLASCFCEPDRDLFLEEQVSGNLARALRRTSPEAASLAEAMAFALRGTEQKSLLAEYARLFLGPFEIPAPPYASVYLEDQRTVMGSSTVAVQGFYRESGLEVDREAHELPDHIAVELEFLGYLASQEAASGRVGASEDASGPRAKEVSFLGDHFLRWAPELCKRIEGVTGSPFYRDLARCLAAFLRELPILAGVARRDAARELRRAGTHVPP